MITLHGIPASPGVAIGPAWLYQKVQLAAYEELSRLTAQAEQRRFDCAVQEARAQLDRLYEKTVREAGEAAAQIFDIHKMMMEDLDYLESVEDNITNQLYTAEHAVACAGQEFAEMFASMDDEVMRARSADIRDITQRLLQVLTGGQSQALKESSVVCAHDLFPSDTMQLDYYPNTVDKALGESVRSYMARVLADLRDYAADFSPATRESLLLVGNAGLGKTHAALAIAGEVLRQNYDVIYVSCPDFFGKLEALHFGTDPGGEEETLFQIACNADLLILDDLGTEFNSSFFLTNLYSLLNNRLGAKLPTIVTTNITDGALLEKLYTEKISSRLAAFVQIQFLGSDIRVQKAAE